MLQQYPQAILFDLDGTLVDSVPDLAVAIDHMLTYLALPCAGEARVRCWVGNGAVKLVQRSLVYAIAVEEGGLPADVMAEELSDAERLTPAYLKKAHQVFLNHYQRCNGEVSRLYPGVEGALAYWYKQQTPMAVVTNKPIQFVPHLLEHVNIQHYFSVLVGGECTEQRKPSAMPLHYACELLSVDPRRCLMIGDSRNDVQAARSAGMPVVAVSYGYNHGEPIELTEPDQVVDQLVELID